jgi:hypothetical protein
MTRGWSSGLDGDPRPRRPVLQCCCGCGRHYLGPVEAKRKPLCRPCRSREDDAIESALSKPEPKPILPLGCFPIVNGVVEIPPDE